MATAQAVYLPENVKIGAVARYIDSSIIQTGDTEHEFRSKRAPLSRRAWTVSWVVASVPTAERMYEVFGTHTSFLFRPSPLRPADYTETAQAVLNTVTGLGTGDGTTATFQLTIARSLGTVSGAKTIKHPRTTTVVIRVATVVKTETTHYTIDYTTGIVTFTGGNIPTAGQAVDADFQYDTPVRFMSEELETTIEQGGSDPIQEVRSATVIEVFDE